MRPTTALSVLGFMLLAASCGTSDSLRHIPDLAAYNGSIPVTTKHSDTLFTSGHNSLLKNKQGLWELYVEGDPLERGLVEGSLTDSLLKKQERIFFEKIGDLVPSRFRQKLLRKFLAWYNRKLYLNVPNEFQAEIYGISQYTSHDFDNIAPQYLRSLYLHGAHDIGHALQDLALVGCSSFAAWGEKSADGNLILGRNFDFYVGDAFAKDKIVAFIKPKTGYPFMIVTWAGMIGAVSGMNNEGLTVTINAGKSKIPLVAKTPISIVTREILQYARTIDEAIAVAKKRKVFVSESIMIGSAADKRAVLIEVSPKRFGVYDVPNSSQLLCSNHFQSENLKNDSRNTAQIANSHSKYRYEKLEQLFDSTSKVTPQAAAEMLRNRDGLGGKPIGYGNEKALNQMLAHHGIIFRPEQRQVWVSANPYQMGEFVCYDLNTVFGDRTPGSNVVSLAQTGLDIPKDPFLATKAYRDYEEFRVEDRKMDLFLKNNKLLPSGFAVKYQSLNPDYWLPFYKSALSHYRHREYETARHEFEDALAREITTVPERRSAARYLKKTKRKLR